MSLREVLKTFRTKKPPASEVAAPIKAAAAPTPLEALSIEGASEGLWHWDLTTKRLRVSKGWAEILGWEPEDIGDRPEDWFALIHPYYVAGVRMDLEAHVNGQKDRFESEYRIRHRNGSYRWVLCRGRVILNDDGQAAEMSGVQTDVTRLIEVENRLVEEALHDRLTGLPNRNFFNARVQRALEEQRENPRFRFAILFLDLDRFKEINDTLGHLVGDQLLASTARRLRECVRSEDFVARFGGDEFVVLVEAIAGHRDAEAMAERIQTALAEPYQLDGHQVLAMASVGIVMSDQEIESAEELIRNADIAMYQAKSDGKANSRVYSPAMYERIERSWKLENDLRGAIERNELSLVYQPQVCAHTGIMYGAEALLRWRHADGTNIPPSEFIPLAEKSDLILEIGEWVIRTAFTEALGWQDLTERSSPQLKIAVNVSAVQLLRAGFVEQVEQIIRETGIDPRSVELELTESVLVDSLERVPAVLDEIERKGIRLAIDDFGTGYSSMSYLRNLMPAVIKIDRMFITDVATDARAGALTKGLISLAHDLGVKVIAEGVEDGEQLAFLQTNHCDMVQGYYASRPIGPEQFCLLIEENRPLIPATGTLPIDGDLIAESIAALQ